jgi:transposase
MPNDIVIAVDVAKSVFEVAVSDRPGHVSKRDRRNPDRLLAFFLAYPGATVVMEACGSAHYWGRELQKRGHRVVLLSPHHVRPYVRGNKTDRTDAKGILEAYRNAAIQPVPVKSVSQQSLTALHRFRSGWMKEVLAEQTPAVVWLLTIPGIGLITATALVAFIGDIRRFPSGRHLASYLGLTPREFSSGLKRRLGRISKRGDGYLRTLLIHGARSVLIHARKQQPDRLRSWANDLAKTRAHNKAAVAVANKLARIVWAVWTRNVPYQGMPKAA